MTPEALESVATALRLLNEATTEHSVALCPDGPIGITVDGYEMGLRWNENYNGYVLVPR